MTTKGGKRFRNPPNSAYMGPASGSATGPSFGTPVPRFVPESAPGVEPKPNPKPTIELPTTLELMNNKKPYKFKSLGIIMKHHRNSENFPQETVYELIEGKFPLEGYTDLNQPYKLKDNNGNIHYAKLVGYGPSCEDLNGTCTINIERMTENEYKDAVLGEGVGNPLHGLGKRKSRRNRKNKKSRKSKTRKNGRKSNRRR